MNKELHKVTAFVVGTREPSSLLVFRHPLAGLQLPAGTRELEETVAAAARREVREETGIAISRDPFLLGDELILLQGSRAVVQCTSDSIDQNGEECTFLRGHSVDILAEKSGFTMIRQNTYDFDMEPPAIIDSRIGWVPSVAVVRAVRRHFTLFKIDVDYNSAWQQQADGYSFRVQWVPLSTKLKLFGPQQAWLERYRRDIYGSI